MRKSGFHLNGIRILSESSAGRFESVGARGLNPRTEFAESRLEFSGVSGLELVTGHWSLGHWSLCRTSVEKVEKRSARPAPARTPESADLVNRAGDFTTIVKEVNL